MVRFLYVVTLLASIIAGLVLVIGFMASKSAPQEASAASLALAIAVIPYVFTRCVQCSNDYYERRARDRKLLDLLERQSARRDAS